MSRRLVVLRGRGLNVGRMRRAMARGMSNVLELDRTWVELNPARAQRAVEEFMERWAKVHPEPVSLWTEERPDVIRVFIQTNGA